MPADCLTYHQPDEGTVINQISPSEPSGLTGQPVKPFETSSLHPGRRSLPVTGDEIECAANADSDDRAHLGKMAGQPEFLFGASQSNQGQAGATLANPLDNHEAGGLVQRRRRRYGMRARSGKELPQLFCRSFGYALPPADQGERHSEFRGKPTELPGQLRAVYPTGKGYTQQACSPKNWNSIRNEQIGFPEPLVEGRIPPRLHDEIHIRRGDPHGSASFDTPPYEIHCLVEGHRVERAAEYRNSAYGMHGKGTGYRER